MNINHTLAATLLSDLIVTFKGKSPESNTAKRRYKAIVDAARANGFARHSELRAAAFSARKLAEEAAQFLTPEDAERIVGEHANGVCADRPAIAQLVDAQRNTIRELGIRVADRQLVAALLHLDEHNALDHDSRMYLAGWIAEVFLREDEVQARQEFRDIARASVDELSANPEARLDDVMIADVIAKLDDEGLLSDEARVALARVVGEIAIRVVDRDWADAIVERLHTNTRE